MQSEITVKNLKKYFAEIKAVDDISFTVQKGELFGFLGVNGAGKSTLLDAVHVVFADRRRDLDWRTAGWST